MVVGGFVGSAVGQLAGKAMGVVDSFSLKNAFASGLTAGATAGMGGYVKGMEWAQAAGDASKFGHMGKMAMAATASGTNWASNKLAGNNQVSFSWRSVVTSTVSAGAGSLLGFSDQSSMFSRFNEGGGLLNGTLDGIAGAAINYGVGKGLYNQGGWDFGKVATDAFGNALANTAISGAIKGGRAATDKAKMDKMFDATSRKINAKLDAQQHETLVTQQQRITGELGNNADALLSSGTARLESENEASLGRYQHARLNLAESANVSSAAYAADAVALTLRHNSQMQNLRAGANAALAAGMVRGESMHAAGLRNRAPVGPVLITSEQANGYINFMQAQQTQHQQYYASLNGGQKFLYNGGANLFGGLLKGGQAIGDATALFGIQGGNKFNHAWSGVGDGLQYIAQHPVDALVINPAVAAYGHYSSIYAADGLGAMAGTMVGDVLAGSVFAMLGGGSAVGTAGRVGKVVPNNTASSISLSILHTRGYKPGVGERALTKEQYQSLMSQYRGRGPELQAELNTIISGQDYIYRATNMRAVEIYRQNGVVSGRDGGAYMTTDFVGLDPKVLMDRGQVFPAWGEPEVLLRIPTSALDNAVVPRPLGESLSVGWEPFTKFYPAAGSGDIRQFMGTTKTWSDDWIIPLKKN